MFVRKEKKAAREAAKAEAKAAADALLRSAEEADVRKKAAAAAAAQKIAEEEEASFFLSKLDSGIGDDDGGLLGDDDDLMGGNGEAAKAAVVVVEQDLGGGKSKTHLVPLPKKGKAEEEEEDHNNEGKTEKGQAEATATDRSIAVQKKRRPPIRHEAHIGEASDGQLWPRAEEATATDEPQKTSPSPQQGEPRSPAQPPPPILAQQLQLPQSPDAPPPQEPTPAPREGRVQRSAVEQRGVVTRSLGDEEPPEFVLEKADEHINEVSKGLFIGDITAAIDGRRLSAAGVTHVVDLANTLQDRPEQRNVSYVIPRESGDWQAECPSVEAKLVVKVDDVAEAPLDDHFDAINAFVQTAIDEGGVVFVHCFRGKSRSATAVVQFLMQVGR